MNELMNIFMLFAKISTFSFGGGYVAFPIIREANDIFHWMSTTELANTLSLAGMSPGPVAFNAAVGVGYQVAGIPGVIAAFLGIALPCAFIVILVATFFFKIYKYPIIQSVLFILRAVITGIILYAAIDFSVKNKIFIDEKGIIISAATFAILLKTKIHPILIILGAGVLGIFIF
jgi:chromate transporter